MIERDELCRLVPHSGSMCLLDRVIEWNSSAITCETNSHLDSGNPLCCNETLSSVAAIEYGAQAMAVHGSLSESTRIATSQVAYLAAVRDVEFEVDWLHDIDHPLIIHAERLLTDQKGMIYLFSIHALSRLLVKGRLTLMMTSQEH